jgi:endonuclease/exonuclease/phosphatase family metal-dependent hydrolase
MADQAVLRVLTINTAKGDPPYPERIQEMARQVVSLAPDVVICQEVLSTPGGEFDTASVLNAGLGFDCATAPARFKIRPVCGQRVRCSSGLAVLSRFPILSHDILVLESDPADGERLAQVALVQVGGIRVSIANVHLTHLQGRGDLREHQLRQVERSLTAKGPAVVAGDFNARIEATELQSTVLAGGYTDAFVAGGGDRRATTLARYDARIDHIFVRGPGASIRSCSAAIVLDTPCPGGGFPSDHFGVMVTLRFGS